EPTATKLPAQSSGRSLRHHLPARLYPLRKAVRSQPTGRAVAAAIPPSMPVLAVAEMARVGLLDQQIDEGIAANCVCQREGSRLVGPHQRRMDDDGTGHSEPERELHGLDGVVTAIRKVRIVTFAHARD